MKKHKQKPPRRRVLRESFIAFPQIDLGVAGAIEMGLRAPLYDGCEDNIKKDLKLVVRGGKANV